MFSVDEEKKGGPFFFRLPLLLVRTVFCEEKHHFGLDFHESEEKHFDGCDCGVVCVGVGWSGW